MIIIPGRFRRVAAAFEVKVPCESSSGTDHWQENLADLSDLVESFIEREGVLTEIARDDIVIEKSEKEGNDSSEDDDDDDYEDTKDRLRMLLGSGELKDDGGERRRIIDDVEVACGIIGDKEEKNFKRKLMTHLRNKGFDAGLCKSKWEKFGRNPAGKYEYVDVKPSGEDRRYVIELNLAGEFEIARPTARYASLLALLPSVFVGKPDGLKQIVRLMCNEMRRSMKRMGLQAPPWRRNGYMQAKWFGHYKRTVNEASRVSSENREGVRRLVGFEESEKTAAFWVCRKEFGVVDGFRVGLLTAAFNGNRVKT